MPNEDDYRLWKAALFGSDYMIWHDGLDLSAVQSLTGDARETALNMLRQGVERGDSHAAQALAAMGDVRTVAVLRAQLEHSTGSNKVRVARAVHALSPDESLAHQLIPVLEDGALHWGEQMSAAIGLRDFADAASERALLGAVARNGSFLVRYHAAESLLLRWRVVPPAIAEHREIFDLIRSPQQGVVGVVAADEQVRLSEAVGRLERLRGREG